MPSSRGVLSNFSTSLAFDRKSRLIEHAVGKSASWMSYLAWSLLLLNQLAAGEMTLEKNAARDAGQ
jgi:hypothetical protein